MKKILIISQNPRSTWLSTVKGFLTKLGSIEVLTEESYMSRIKKVKCDLILVDSSGIENIVALITLINSKQLKTPIVVAMLARRWRGAREVLRAGATDCILKSASPDMFLSIVLSLLSNPPTQSTKKNYPLVGETILFADNDLDFLETRKTSLENAGYSVVMSTSVIETKQKLNVGGIDLAIIDIRLEDDDDDKDLSGLVIAKKHARSTPKIILTNFPTYEYVRDTLRPQLDGIPVAIDFLSKREGPLALIATIRDMLGEKLVSGKSTDLNIFIAHGRDWDTRDKVARYLKDIGIKPIVLFNEADRGETIIEKLERCCQNADFAIVLMTPDDYGFPKEHPNEILPRARQNVIFELGYLVARLGRRRVRVLYKNVEIPTNFLGVIYIEMDNAGKWKSYLGRELKDAGIPLNKKAGV